MTETKHKLNDSASEFWAQPVKPIRHLARRTRMPWQQLAEIGPFYMGDKDGQARYRVQRQTAFGGC